jgi:hypothetical protein
MAAASGGPRVDALNGRATTADDLRGDVTMEW